MNAFNCGLIHVRARVQLQNRDDCKWKAKNPWHGIIFRHERMLVHWNAAMNKKIQLFISFNYYCQDFGTNPMPICTFFFRPSFSNNTWIDGISGAKEIKCQRIFDENSNKDALEKSFGETKSIFIAGHFHHNIFIALSKCHLNKS